MKNPFSNIVPRDEESLINEESIKKISSKIKKRIKDRRFIILEGTYGSGKSHYLNRLYDRLKTKKESINFTEVIINVLENKVPVEDKTLFIRNFDLLQGFTDEQVYQLTKAIIRLVDEGMIIVTACRKDTRRRVYKINPLIRSRINRIKIPTLTYQQAKKLVIKRLNEARKEENDSLTPFTDKELRRVWRKANKSPRLLFLLLKPLYEQRMMIKE